MTCCVFERGMMAGGAAGAEEKDKGVGTDILVEAGATREDEVAVAGILSLMPAAVAAEESIREAEEAGEVGQKLLEGCAYWGENKRAATIILHKREGCAD